MKFTNIAFAASIVFSSAASTVVADKDKTNLRRTTAPDKLVNIIAQLKDDGENMGHKASQPAKAQLRGLQGNKDFGLSRREEVLKYWTPERVRSARPRHMTLDTEKGNPFDRNLVNDSERKLQTAVSDGAWPGAPAGGHILMAAGRLRFTMGGSNWHCSATAVTDDNTSGRSLIVTAAHCAYDDAAKEFASYFMFIPNQDDGGRDGSDTDCSNDIYGCYFPAFAVVDNEWASRTWSSNIPYDYAFLVVNNDGSAYTSGSTTKSGNLEVDVPALDISWEAPTLDENSHALGYSGSQDPDFRYCIQTLVDGGSVNGGYKLNGCGLTGGSSGGPWVQTWSSTQQGRGEVIAVNSYGPSSGPSYMGGPRLYDNSANCLFQKAKIVTEAEAAGNGIIVTYTPGNCDDSTYVSGDDFNSPTPINWNIGDPVEALSSAYPKEVKQYVMGVSDFNKIKCTTTGNNGDADLYVRCDQEAVVDGSTRKSPNDCKGFSSDSNESCDNLDVQSVEELYVTVHAFSMYSELTLMCEDVEVSAPPSGGCDLAPFDAPCEFDADCCSSKCKGKSGSKTCK